jgi:hypothetical protein
LVELHVSIAVPPDVTLVGLAVSVTVGAGGGGGGGAVTVTVALVVAGVVPLAPLQLNV